MQLYTLQWEFLFTPHKTNLSSILSIWTLKRFFLFKSIEMFCVFEATVSHIMGLCLTTLHAKPKNGNAMCSFMVPGGDE